jgi:hypothetical protein
MTTPRKGNCAWCTGSLEGLEYVYTVKKTKLDFCTIRCSQEYQDYQLGNTKSRWYLALAGVLALFVWTFATAPKARAHDHYMDWKVPGSNASCCNERKDENTGDCEIAPFEVRNGGWYVYIRQIKQWVVVPDSTLLRQTNPDPAGIDGHICWTLPRGVICARPPTGAL